MVLAMLMEFTCMKIYKELEFLNIIYEIAFNRIEITIFSFK